jgi:cellulose synthase (UDP-forming)
MITGRRDEIIKVKAPARTEIRTIRILIGLAAIAMLFFVSWFADPEHIGYAPVYWLLTFALLFKLVKMVHEWYHYWSPSVPVRPESNRQWKVDVLTTACPGEPREMIIRTLKAMVNITYPHTNYLCDEGDDPILKQVCRDLGVVHVTRTIKKDAKAGNINNALRQATGEICVVLDPDHEPVPQFLDRVLPYFEDEKIGFVQCVQAYGNQEESFIARGAAEQTYHFYGPMMMCMNTYGTVQAIGANCTFRRSALDSIGGHAAGLSEDMHTAMQLHAKGWKSVYVPEVLTRGLVPATLSSYYKQQLKWSRGTFELLFRTLPHLWSKFTWRQKIHYFTIPLYFLFGLINLIDILIPILALSLAEVPWEVNLGNFALYFVPLCGISMIIRLYAQRWLLEEHEKGFHFAGGVLRLATWWIFLIGFIYTIFKVKVPYIPTPKEDEHQNYVRLSVPNMLVLLISAAFVFYGLSIDWTPYSIAMASYSLMSAGMLAFTVIMSQQKLLVQARTFCRSVPAISFCTTAVSAVGTRTQQVAYHFLKNGPLMVIMALSLFFLSYSSIEKQEGAIDYTDKKVGAFYLGSTNGNQSLPPALAAMSSIASFDAEWNCDLSVFEGEFARAKADGSLPFLRWNFRPGADSAGSSTYKLISGGAYDDYLRACASFFRNYSEPLFITLPQHNAPRNEEAFRAAWQHVYTFFNSLGISNLTWVWVPADAASISYYPGEKFVDWIGLSALNYAASPQEKGFRTFGQIYEPFRKAYGPLQKSVLCADLGCVKGPQQEQWTFTALNEIKNKYTEIRGAVLFTGHQTEVSSVSGSQAISFEMDPDQLSRLTAFLQREEMVSPENVTGTVFSAPARSYRSPFVKGTPGHYQLLIKDRPYYIRGVAYNTAHDWRDGNMPLTRRQVVKDLDHISAMGANTIRRYGTGIYDRNVLNIAAEKGVNVLYGFWFDPKVDYFEDEEKVQEYIREVEETVLAYRDHPSVLAWSLGNESWGLLKHRFAKPYLVKVRNSYVRMIEHLAQRIHELDPTRPVLSCVEHEEYQLAGELVAFRDQAPSIDVMGVNSYYREQIENLNHLAWQFDSLRPYLVSEFGPAGYWDPKYNKTSNGSLVEQTDAQKAEWYRQQWIKYVNGYKGYNVGGFAYCWHDRMEGSHTWFGLTDYRGRPKAAYYTLKEEWTKENSGPLPAVTIKAPGELRPGQSYTFQATCAVPTKKGWHYEWRLLKDEYLEEVDNLDELEADNSIVLTVPEQPSNYRLYVYVTDEEERWVSTASVPVKVQAKNRN